MPHEDYSTIRTLTDEACSKIKQLMFQRKITPGQKLLYKELAGRFGMSQTPIISALNRLEEQGFLASAPFRGFYVKVLSARELHDIFEVREALESYIVEIVIARMNADDVAALEEKRRLHCEYTPEHYDNKRLILDAEFHVRIAQVSRNEILEKQLRRIFEHIYLRFLPETRLTARMATTAREHDELLRRMGAKDVQASVALIREHIRGGKENLLKSMAEGDEDFVKNYFGSGASDTVGGGGGRG